MREKGKKKGKVAARPTYSSPTYRKHEPSPFRPPGVRPGDPDRETVRTHEKSALRRSVKH